MKILYIFPHPDDESFGPAPGIYQQLSQGHEVYLLTLTKGGATKIRHELGLSVDEMGDVRFKEMQCVEKVLGLTEMTVLDLPDSGLKNMNPLEIESVVSSHIQRIKPDVVVTYAVHGISGFFDHLVSHAVVKRVFCQLKQDGHSYLKRLALFTVDDKLGGTGPFGLTASAPEDIDCKIKVTEAESEKGKEALACYKTYASVIEKTGVAEHTHLDICFEFFQDSFDSPVGDITAGL